MEKSFVKVGSRWINLNNVLQVTKLKREGNVTESYVPKFIFWFGDNQSDYQPASQEEAKILERTLDQFLVKEGE